MKHLKRPVQTALALAAVFALPHLAFARQVTSVTPSPTSASVTAGLATNVTANVAVVSGSGASTRYLGFATNTTFVTPNEPTITATLNPTSFVFPNANVTSNTTLTVSTSAGTPSGTYIVSIVVGTNPPNANIVSVTNTFTLNVGVTFVPQTIWTNGAANLNWSSSGNWTGNAAPVSSNDVTFFDISLVGTQGQVDNTVNSSMSIGSLTFGQTNNYHTTQISSGATLTVGGNASGLNAGTGTDPGDGLVTFTTITGAGGTLAVTNKNSTINIGQAHSTSGNAVAQSRATVDMSGLDNFSATVSRVLVGVDTVTLKGACGVLNLAKTNTITVTTGSAGPQIDVGDNSQATGTPTIQSILSLGQTNGIFADSIAVGRGKTDNNGGLMIFNSAFTSPTAFFRGTNGTASRVGTWSIGDGATARTYYTYGTCDFSLGSVNALVDTMYLGKGATGSTPQNAGTGTLTFGAGTVDVNTLEVGYSFNATGTGTGTVNANGGTLLVNTFLELAHGPGSSGTLNISNATVTANGGITQGGGTASISMTGGTLNVTNGSATIGTTASPLSSLNVTNATIKLAVQGLAPTIATANLSADGAANTINISSVPLLTGFPTQFPLIQYGLNGGSAGGNLSSINLGTLPSGSPAYSAYISNNVANNSIDIIFTGGPSTPALTWVGSPTGNWDLTTTNWKPKSGPNTAFANGNFATFDESLTGTPNVNLTTTLSPATVTVSNATTSYVFSGAGSLTGSAVLLKNGSGSLTLSETGGDNFSGGITVNNGTVILNNANSAISGGATINGGTVQVGNNGTAGSLPAGNVVDSGALVFNHTDNITVTNAISGAGTITQSGTGTVTLTGNNTFTGTATMAQGTLAIGNTNGLGLATSVTVNNGATFDVGGVALFGNGNTALIVTAAGAGVGGNGAIVNNSTNDVTRTLHTVTLTADTAFGGISDWDIRNSSGTSATADAALNGAFNLTKVGTNALTLRGVTIDPNLGNINVQEGSVTITATATAPQNSLGNSSATATVYSNATLTLDTIGNVPAKNFVLNNGGTLKSSSTNTVSSQVTLTGTANNGITAINPSQFFITSAIGGGGGFTKNGSGVLFLTANNTYSGNTVVSGGTLALYGGSDGSISSSVSVNINSGGIVDVSGRSDGTFTLSSGQTLIGGAYGTNVPAIPGIITGRLVVSLGAVLSPGTGFGSTNAAIGTLSVSSNAILQGTTFMKVSGTNGNDQIVAAGITYGGTLIITNIAGTITDGQTFQLFIASNGLYNAGSFSSVTLPSAVGLSWTNNLTVNGTITAGVVGSAPPPSIASISPNTGRTNGGTVVTITGANFVNGVTAQFGANAPVTATFNSSTSLTVATPANAAGAVVVTVTNPDTQTGTSGFTYVLPPPAATVVAGSVKISGSILNMVWLGGTNNSCPLLTTTSLALPVSWSPVATNAVGADGLFTNSIGITPGEPKRFFRLSVPYN